MGLIEPPDEAPALRCVVAGLYEVIWAAGDERACIYRAGVSESGPLATFRVAAEPDEQELLAGLADWLHG